MKKYELTTNTKTCFGRKLYQIKALKDFGYVKAGDLGGYIEKEENLSQDGIAWVFDNACVYDNARVSCNAYVCGNACVYDNAQIYDSARICDDVCVYGNAYVYGDARVFGNACVCDNAEVSDNARVLGNAQVYGTIWIHCDAQISSNADYICFKGFGSENRNTIMFKTKNGDVYVCCGCFEGSLKEFMDKVKETHGNTKYAKEYLACIEVAKIHFEIDE
jgi:UDP-3-O-[3-hydroxymyristoyl] glucosamine N-acyltransferase